MTATPLPFQEQLRQRTLTYGTRLCLGLDPRLDAYRDVAHLREHTLDVLEACAGLVACVKPQLAFYEVLGPSGYPLLQEVCALARTLGLPVLLDGKRGDIGSTAQAYAQAWLSGPHAGSALTINAYLGWETLTPFVEVARAHGGGVFVLVRTSNPGSADLQQSGVAEKVAAQVAQLGQEEDGDLSCVGAVVGATHPEELEHFRALMPKATLLLPGLGAQGARASDLAPAFLPGGVGAVVSASRGIQYVQGLDVRASMEAARNFRNELNAALTT
ncbi:orotidine-5'-phosphate decarboxylase [Deinococcus peraridilitoris]|uniref:Orotidine 5'-phosphate decarboxylase n=1 Tax=Deinococcus peraridilitoris (strain DSM 19664 / LMG 22246 / CIP 109416 / KR-200) TaxID=937777 RepID=L0A052_DEIPD|nr:orotidine-5'-phosphate decarboxylase [Deinococcus peraridilitoris]AFZ66552.1 orotidine 5''-phosphate decarboxylase, subfamily 2 [Deinococcus peraridilitoris DSM 19664]